MKKYLNKIYIIAVLVCVASFPIYAQEEEDRPWIGILLSISTDIDIDGIASGLPIDDALFQDEVLSLGVQVMFPVGWVVSIGPEIGISYPLGLIDLAIREDSSARLADRIHFPIRFVVDVAFTENFRLDLLAGFDFAVLSNDTTLDGGVLTFDLGARLDVFGFFLGAVYTLPHFIDLRSGSIASSGLIGDTRGTWNNSLAIELGYRFLLPL